MEKIYIIKKKIFRIQIYFDWMEINIFYWIVIYFDWTEIYFDII